MFFIVSTVFDPCGHVSFNNKKKLLYSKPKIIGSLSISLIIQ